MVHPRVMLRGAGGERIAPLDHQSPRCRSQPVTSFTRQTTLDSPHSLLPSGNLNCQYGTGAASLHTPLRYLADVRGFPLPLSTVVTARSLDLLRTSSDPCWEGEGASTRRSSAPKGDKGGGSPVLTAACRMESRRARGISSYSSLVPTSGSSPVVHFLYILRIGIFIPRLLIPEIIASQCINFFRKVLTIQLYPRTATRIKNHTIIQESDQLSRIRRQGRKEIP